VDSLLISQRRETKADATAVQGMYGPLRGPCSCLDSGRWVLRVSLTDFTKYKSYEQG
jgi:hypothetical protein